MTETTTSSFITVEGEEVQDDKSYGVITSYSIHYTKLYDPPPKQKRKVSAGQKLMLAVVLCAVLCLLFPVAAPLFFSLFIGIAIRESGMKPLIDFISGPLLYGSTFILGLLLGVLCEAHLLLDPKILILLILGIVALILV